MSEQILETIVKEMKLQAEQNPISIDKMLAGIDSFSFPENLRRTELIDEFGVVNIQFSHDQLGLRKHIEHLSFSREDLKKPTMEMIKVLKTAFFYDNNHVITLPSNLPFVVQLGKIAES